MHSCNTYDQEAVRMEANQLKPVPVVIPLTTWLRNKANARPDPRLDASGNISILITWQTKGYKNADPAIQHEKALPVSFYCYLYRSTVTHFDHGIANL